MSKSQSSAKAGQLQVVYLVGSVHRVFGCLKAFDKNTLLIDNKGKRKILFKSAISSLRAIRDCTADKATDEPAYLALHRANANTEVA